MHAYFMDDIRGDQRFPHDSGRAVSDDVLKSCTGTFPSTKRGPTKTRYSGSSRRDYKNYDVTVINKESLSDELETKIKTFYHEHMHEDVEIRYILEGTGYFDEHEHATESWIRCRVGVGDFLLAPTVVSPSI